MGDVTFGEMRDGETVVIRTISVDAVGRCPHAIFMAEHYNADGSCRCEDPSHTEMKEWGYRWDGEQWGSPIGDKVVGFHCPSCGDPYDGEIDTFYAPMRDAHVCFYCYEGWRGGASTIVRYVNGEKQIVRYDQDFASVDDEEVERRADLPDWFTERFVERGYHRTDAWRGYHDSVFSGLTKLAAGWLTGHPDESKPQAAAMALQDGLNTGWRPPKPLYWLFEPSSNVFSTVSALMVEDADVDEITGWLNSRDITIEGLERAFS